MVNVSVVIPAFNEEKNIGRCLRSLYNQSLPMEDYELIVVDDGSRDNTLKEITKFKDNLIYIKNKKNLGLPYSLNRGIESSKGKYIVRVDADDYVHQDYLRILNVALNQNNNIDAVSCDYVIVDERQNKKEIKNCEDYPIGCAIMYRREQLIEVGMYDEQFLAREEEEFADRFNLIYKTTRLPIPLYYYYLHGNNLTLNKEKMEYYKKLLVEKKK